MAFRSKKIEVRFSKLYSQKDQNSSPLYARKLDFFSFVQNIFF